MWRGAQDSCWWRRPLRQPTATSSRKVDAYVAAHQGEVVAELVQALSIPDVAPDTANIRRKAELLAGMFRKRGFDGRRSSRPSGNPLVYAELKNPRAKRTLLLYAHYDGQPFDQKLWKQESPFKPILRDGRMEDGAKDLADFRGHRSVRARLARLRALGVRRHVADRRGAGRGRRAEGDRTGADVESEGHPRRRGGGRLGEPAGGDREAQGHAEGRPAADPRRPGASDRTSRRSSTARAASSPSSSPSTARSSRCTAATTATGCRTRRCASPSCSRR